MANKVGDAAEIALAGVGAVPALLVHAIAESARDVLSLEMKGWQDVMECVDNDRKESGESIPHRRALDSTPSTAKRFRSMPPSRPSPQRGGIGGAAGVVAPAGAHELPEERVQLRSRPIPCEGGRPADPFLTH